MIRTKIHGISIVLAIIFTVVSCNSVKNIQKGAIVLTDFYKYYINDSISLSYRFPADYKQITDREEIRNNLQKINKRLPLNQCITCLKTFIPPDLTHCTFYYPDKKRTTNKLLINVKKDTNDFYIDTKKYIVGKYTPLENNKGSIYIIGHSKKNEFINLKGEYADIFNHIITNEKYRAISFKSPFDIGSECEILEDTTINYLSPISRLKNSEPNYYQFHTKWSWQQAYATYLSRLSNENDNLQEIINQWRKGQGIVSTQNALHIDDDALSFLIQKCKDERVVMLNENHFNPQNRILGEILLDSLYNYGFRYFGMEAIWENDTMLNNRGFAVTHTGFYSREPMMANLIRKAIEKGYDVFGYDDFTKDREKNQALNICKKTLAKDSLSKVLIFAGIGHIDEAAGPKTWMARDFFLLTGIDPLTIEQQRYITQDAYLMILDTTTLSYRNMTCDIFIANNIDYELFATKSGYEDYNITIPTEITAQIEPLMFVVSIFKIGEYQKDKTAIPIYNHLLNNDATQVKIKLRAGNYYFIIKNRYGAIVYQGNL